MEDGDNNRTKVISNITSDNDASILPNMANYPDIEITVIKNKNTTDNTTETKVNGESDGKDDIKKESSSEKEDSTDDDILVIDEEYKSRHTSPINRKRLLSPGSRSSFKGFKKRMLRKSTEVLKSVNDYISATESGDGENLTSEEKCDKFDESINQGESLNVHSQDALTKIVTNYPTKEDIKPSLLNISDPHTTNTNLHPECENTELLQKEDSNSLIISPKHPTTVTNKLKTKKLPSPKLTEYAQYLGLQPTVKFKCYKCSDSSFSSMNALNDHQQQCLAQPTKENPVINPTSNSTSTNFRVTRKVYLCSACGTYYENWNLFLHMREVHRRFICLYCLGMFSLVEKLTQHLITKHNCSPTSYLSAEEYLNSYKDSCFLMCCHCENIFTEQDNFFEHICTERATFSEKNCWSCGIKGTHPHLASCKASIEPQKSTKTKDFENMESEPSTSNQKLKIKTKKVIKKTFSNVEHITADSPAPFIEKTCDIANLCTVDMEPTIKIEPESPEKSPRDDDPEENPQDEQNDPENQQEPENSNNNPENYNTEQDPNNSPQNDSLEETHDKTDQENYTSEHEKENCEDDIDTKSEHDNDNDDNLHSDDTQNDISAEENNKEQTENQEYQNETSMDIPENENFVPIETNSNETNTKIINENSNDFPQSDSDRNLSVSETEQEMEPEKPISPEIRRVPKVTLKLPKPGTFSDHDSEDSEKLTMEIDGNDESEEEKQLNGIESEKFNDSLESDGGLQIAGDEVPILELELDKPLDKFDTEGLIKLCLNATIPTCIYCNHARKIAVNGKNLGLHAIAEHRFAATVNSITAEELIPNNFVLRIKEGLKDVEDKYFNLDTTLEPLDTTELTFRREYECFQCRYITTIHKELYLHNRKMHAKTILLCIMCKSNFYSYSELICHLCPGDYVLNNEMRFRCCMCEIPDLPSAFRLMVHLRKRHHTCDVCLEGCQNQSRLSNHVWKHKLHHLCYRCGIAYRNKPDITKHLFWKHGTESVLCKKCLQKKWPHVYHFCIPPTAFVCEECNLSFSRAVYLKVHKRLHLGEKKHFCTEENCTEGFVSKKLQLKHEKRHREPEPIPEKPIELINGDLTLENEVKPEVTEENKEEIEEKQEDKEEKKNIIDVYDLPALNLSESDSSDTEEEKSPIKENNEESKEDIVKNDTPTESTNTDEQKSVEIVDGIWENFKQYQATIEKRDSFNIENKDDSSKDDDIKMNDVTEEKLEKLEIKEPLSEVTQEIIPDLEVILADHDYCIISTEKKFEDNKVDHDYCNAEQKNEKTGESKGVEAKKRKDKKKTSSSSDSSSDSDSSSCTCGSNCSCSSSSGSSSSSSSSSDSESTSSEGKRRIAARRERRKERAKRKKESETSQAASNNSVDVVATEDNVKPILPELPIEESDLETDETETDEDFYDEHPQRLANKMLEEKRNQLLLLAGVTPPITNGSIIENSRPSTPSIPDEMPPKKKVKSKKRKKKSRCATPKHEPQNIPFQNHRSPITIHPPTPILPQLPPVSIITTPIQPKTSGSGSETDSNVRSSKRRRVPNKFYGYSSDEESTDKPPAPPILKWRKADFPTPVPQIIPKIVPPITIKNIPIPTPQPIIEPSHATVVHHGNNDSKDSDSESDIRHQKPKSSSESSDSNRNEDSDSDGQLHISANCQPQFTLPIQRNENLYCYCQCPYDEVSEMIACDGRECAIEWFHFECVGIMVPPKGKWYCPDCRKKAAMRSDYVQT